MLWLTYRQLHRLLDSVILQDLEFLLVLVHLQF